MTSRSTLQIPGGAWGLTASTLNDQRLDLVGAGREWSFNLLNLRDMDSRHLLTEPTSPSRPAPPAGALDSAQRGDAPREGISAHAGPSLHGSAFPCFLHGDSEDVWLRLPLNDKPPLGESSALDFICLLFRLFH